MSDNHRPPLANAPLDPLERLKLHLLEDKVTRIGVTFLDRYLDIHLKDIDVDEMDAHRGMRVGSHRLVNFGSDSFLGLDWNPRVQQAMIDALRQWGTHNGASRAFSNCGLCSEAERRLADWLGVEDTLIYTSVTLANTGLIPAHLSHDTHHGKDVHLSAWGQHDVGTMRIPGVQLDMVGGGLEHLAGRLVAIPAGNHQVAINGRD